MIKYLKLTPFYLFFISVSILVFSYQANRGIDPDLGWHLRLGELTLKEGIFETDPFSYTMPSFPFIDHEWFTNITLYYLYDKFGKLFLSIVFSVIAVLAYLIPLVNQSKGNKLIKVGLFVLTVGLLHPYFGIRPQVVSWLMYSLFLKFIFSEKFEKYAYLVPFILMIWANVHGSFPLPIITLLIVSLVKTVKSGKIWLVGVISILLAIVATGINPYGYKIWHEVFQQVTDTSVRWVLVEWKPSFYSFNIFYLIFTVLYVFSLKRYFSLFKLEMVALNIFLFLQGLSSVRHVPLWVLINLPMCEEVFNDFYKDIKKIKFGEHRFKQIVRGGLTLIIVLYTANLITYLYPKGGGLTETNFYPKEAVGYLAENQSSGNIYSEYGWGGYLIWKHSQKKVFIDGRMATWKWNESVLSESNYIMNDYVEFINGRLDMKENIEKYDIDTVLWPNRPVVSSTYAFEMYFRNKVLRQEPRKVFSAHQYFLNNGWRVVYSDSVATVYRKD